jgi:hypothetical protein
LFIAEALLPKKASSTWRVPKASPRQNSALAARVALRVFPLTFLPLLAGEDPNANLILQTARALLVTDMALRYGVPSSCLEQAQNSISIAVFGASPAGCVAASRAAAFAAQAQLFKANNAIIENSAARSAAVEAAQDAVRQSVLRAESVGELDKAIRADIDWIGKDREIGIIDQSLWLVDVRGDPNYAFNFPPWVRKPFDQFKALDWVVKGPWRIWIDWYLEFLVSRARRSRFNDRVILDLALQNDSFWKGDPHGVTAVIAETVGYEWDYSGWQWPNQSPARGVSALGSEANAERSVDPMPNAERSWRKLPTPVVEAVNVHSDEPTAVDQLNRWPFAKALVEHMDEVYRQRPREGDGFAIHIHAPWGAGKTSVLEMMKQMLEAKHRATKGGEIAPQWIVVSFNAWRNERRMPPWWPLVQNIKTACLSALSVSDPWSALRVKRLWTLWKVTTDLLPYTVSMLVLVVSVAMIWYTWGAAGASNLLENILKLLTALFAVTVTFVGASRFAVFGSSNGAKFYEELSSDPLKRLMTLFERMVSCSGRPICVFIDDLDRCRPEYVVSLLQGVQTVFRNSSVTYVVAADRNWIRTSFENQYSAVVNTIGSPTQPLGYLFLEKVFQVSTPLPGVGARTRAAYWDSLLRGAGVPNGSVARPSQRLSEEAVEEKREQIRKESPALTRAVAEERLRQRDTPEDRVALALELSTSQAAEAETTHLLAEFREIVPDIPRVMKRMINAYAIRQAIGLIEDNAVPIRVLARWTILEQYFPALADALAEHPGWVDGMNLEPNDPFATVMQSERVLSIVGKGEDRLTKAHVEAITRGSVGNPLLG